MYINNNFSIREMSRVVEENINRELKYMSNDFNYQQKEALELFKKRIYLEEVIEETISFNKKLSWENLNENLNLTTTAEELVGVYKLRSDIYKQMNYIKEFPDIIESLNFDSFDKTSAIIYYKKQKEITGTCRFIFDSDKKLPSEEKLCFDDLREKYKYIGELSRNMVKHKTKGLNMEFKYLMAGIHNVFNNNEINISVFVIKDNHYNMISRFGGLEIIKTLNGYGNLEGTFYI